MAEYIDKRCLLEYVKKLPKYYVDSCWQQEDPDGFLSPEDVIGSIENAPNIDVAPVVHGYYTQYGDGEKAERVCSVCKESAYTTKNAKAWKRCPFCGAKFDGEVRK